MIVSREYAVRFFNSMPEEMKSFYFHPEYVISDAVAKGLKPLFFIIEEGNSFYYHAFHLGKIKDTSYYDIQTPYGYGGPLVVGGREFKTKCILAYKQWCHSQSVIVEFIRFHPLLKNNSEYYGQVDENRSVVYMDLTVKNLLSSFSSRIRWNIKQSLKEEVKVTFNKSYSYVEQFISNYSELMNQKSASKDYLFNEIYFDHIISQDSVYLVSAENDQGSVIGSAIFFECGEFSEYHLSASTEEGRLKNVSSMLIFSFANYLKENSAVTKLYLGGGATRKKEDPLLFFKKGFSKHETTYSVGYYKHNLEIYEQLKNKFSIDSGNIANILFYR